MAFKNSAGIENGVLEESAILFRPRPQSLSVRSVCLVAKPKRLTGEEASRNAQSGVPPENYQ